MRVVECAAPGELRLAERPKPTSQSGHVLVRIRRVGMCGTDFHIFKGDQPFVTYPRVLGHELSGEVEDAPSDSGLKSGDRVCVRPYIACGLCVACRREKPNCCAAIKVLGVHADGGLVDFLSVPAEYLLKANDLSLDALAMTEFLAIGRHAVRRAQIEPGQRALVVGAGPIGVGVAMFAQLDGAEVTTLDPRADRRAFCSNVLKAKHTLEPGADDALREITGGAYFDVVFDATGNRTAMQQGFRYVAHGGAYVLVSIVQGDVTFNDPEFHKRETTLYASRNAIHADFADVIEAMRNGDVPLAALNTHRAALEDLPSQLSHWASPDAGVIKAIVEL